jgi:DNA (cytosine-5)-methyltransferase 1
MKYEVTNFCEIDKYAATTYCGIHREKMHKNLGDIIKVKKADVKPFNVLVGGSPCQDFSAAGKKAGSVWTCKDCGYAYNPMSVSYNKRKVCPVCNSRNLDKTRSSLLIYYLQFVRNFKPNFGLYENVKDITADRNKITFDNFVSELGSYGYNVYYKIMNGKDYGIPQSRNRVFVLYIKKELDNGKFKFPKEKPLKYKLIDYCDLEVDKKYYMSEHIYKRLLENFKDYANLQEGINVVDKSIKNPCIKTIANCLTTHESRTLSYLPQVGTCIYLKNDSQIQIRNITPLECFRLFGFTDKDYDRARKMLMKHCYNGKDKTQSQMYKMAGNSIIVNCPYYILVELYKAMPYLFDDIKLCSLFSGIGAFEKAFELIYNKLNGIEQDVYKPLKKRCNMLMFGCAERGKLISGKYEQRIDVKAEEVSNAITITPKYSMLYIVKEKSKNERKN